MRGYIFGFGALLVLVWLLELVDVVVLASQGNLAEYVCRDWAANTVDLTMLSLCTARDAVVGTTRHEPLPWQCSCGACGATPCVRGAQSPSRRRELGRARCRNSCSPTAGASPDALRRAASPSPPTVTRPPPHP